VEFGSMLRCTRTDSTLQNDRERKRKRKKERAGKKLTIFDAADCIS
jgi:hypothetical protein